MLLCARIAKEYIYIVYPVIIAFYGEVRNEGEALEWFADCSCDMMEGIKNTGGKGMRKLMILLLCLLVALPVSGEAALEGKAMELLDHMKAGDEDAVLAMMDDSMKGAMKGQVKALWDSLLASFGAFQEAGARRASSAEGYDVIELTLVFDRAKLIQRTVFDGGGRVAGLFFVPGEVAEKAGALPAGVSEQAVTVDAGTGFPLEGTLTLPEDGKIIAGLVLVQGSGPSDRDEKVYANVPFQDLAWGLASRGIAVLRFDKRTFVHGQRIAQSPDYAIFTVDEETALDAAAAVSLLKNREELAGKKVFILGHSLGGMLTAYINTLGAGADGYINLAGSPRKLWQISADQNEMMAQEMEAAGDSATAGQIRQGVGAEIEKAQGLLSLSDEEAKAPGNLVMGLPAWYQRHLAGIDAAALHLADGLPVLILHGGKDRQITMTDYTLWQERLKAHPDASFKLYPELNHLFGQFEGELPPFSQISLEYSQRTPIPDMVMDDIAQWISQRSE